MIRFYDQSTITYNSCFENAHCIFDGFKTDYFFESYHPHLFGVNPTLHEPLRDRVFDRLKRAWARHTHLAILDGSHVVFNAYTPKNTVAATALYIRNYTAPKLGMIEWVKWAFYKVIYSAIDLIEGHPLEREFFTPPFVDFFDVMYKDAGTVGSDDYYEKLAASSSDELSEMRYPLKDTLYLDFLSVASDAQGQGYGSKLLKYTLNYYKDTPGPVFGSTQGPAKVALFPTKGNDKFYERYGFKTAFEKETVLGNGDPWVHKYMQLVLPAKI